MFDCNAKLGHWPYRPVTGLDTLLDAMDRFGVEKALVSSLNAVHYLNPHDGNRELLEIVDDHRDRLLPAAVIRPDFTGWLEDLQWCVLEQGVRAVVLYPNYHGYELTDPGLAPLMSFAAENGVPVAVQAGLEDPRRQYRDNKVFEVPPAATGGLARTYPETTVVAFGLKWTQPELAEDSHGLPPNFYFDTSNYERLGELEFAVDRFGPEKILLGSNFPLFNPRANIDKLRCAQISDAARDAIASRNARRVFGI